ncbi:MAG: 50S ribosomal protein L11 [Candidatus Micrarchaeia archaeon]
MASITIPALVEGGKATAGPPLGPSLAPTGVNIGKVIGEINAKTKDFAGMQVPIKVRVDKGTKEFSIEIGTPPVSALIKKEIGIKEPAKEEEGVKGKKTIGNITIDQIIKIARQKTDATLTKTLKNQVKEITGTCLSLGVTVEGKNARETAKDIDAGTYDAKINA